MRLQSKLILIFLLLSIVPLSISGFFLLSTLDDEISERIEYVLAEELSVLAERMSWSVERVEQGVRQTAVSFPIMELNREEQTGFLRLLYRQVPLIDGVVLVDGAGEPLSPAVYLDSNTATAAQLQGHNFVSESEVLGAISLELLGEAKSNARGVAWGDALWLQGSPVPHFPLVVRVAQGRGDSAYLVALVSSADLIGKLGAFTLKEDRQVALVELDQSVLVKNGFKGRQMGNALPDEERKLGLSEEAWSTTQKGNVNVVLRERGGKGGDTVLVFAGVRQLDLRLVWQASATAAFGYLHDLRKRQFFLFFTILVSALILAIFFARSLTGPIKALAEAVTRVGSGDFKQSVQIRTGDEIGDLSQAFNEMAARLHAQNQEIQRQSDEISQWNVELQARVDERTRELKEAQDYLIHTQKLAAVAEISSGVAHELNNPLAVVLGFVQILKDKHRGEGDAEGPLLGRIEEQAQRCREIVQHLLSFSQAQVDQGSKERVDFSEVIRTVIRLFGAYFTSRKVDLQDQLPSPLFVYGNRGQLMQATLQLISAVRSTIPKDGVLNLDAVVEQGKVQVRLVGSLEGLGTVGADGSLSSFSTEDRDQALSQGLGLWLSQKIIQEHGGLIAIERGGEVTSVVVTLPQNPPKGGQGANA